MAKTNVQRAAQVLRDAADPEKTTWHTWQRIMSDPDLLAPLAGLIEGHSDDSLAQRIAGLVLKGADRD